MPGGYPYDGQRAVLATRHGKLAVIAPALEPTGLRITTADLDTDALGTFAGEIPRTLPMREAAVAKARMGMEQQGCAIGLASEGTIGPDPMIPLLFCDTELVVLVDDEQGLVIWETARDHGVRAATTVTRPGHHILDFLDQAGFPGHRLIVRPEGMEPADVPAGLLRKGIADHEALAQAIRDCSAASPTGHARVESDLRAHCSPTRQQVIARAAQRLAARVIRRCPDCGAPGWGRIGTLNGLPCASCATWIAFAHRGVILGCTRCPFRREVHEQRAAEDPARCPNCNP